MAVKLVANGYNKNSPSQVRRKAEQASESRRVGEVSPPLLLTAISTLCYRPHRSLRQIGTLHLAPDWFGGLCPGGSLHGALRVSVYYSSVRLR